MQTLILYIETAPVEELKNALPFILSYLKTADPEGFAAYTAELMATSETEDTEEDDCVVLSEVAL